MDGAWTRLRRTVLSPTWVSFGVIVSALLFLPLRVAVLLADPPGSAERWYLATAAASLIGGYWVVWKFGTELLLEERAKRRPWVEMSRPEGMRIIVPVFFALFFVALFLGGL